MSSKDEVFPAEEQPLRAAEDPEEDPIDYPADRGDSDDDDDESYDDDEDDDDDVEEDEDEEEEEHPALADSVPSPVHCVTARMSIRDEPPIPFWSERLYITLGLRYEVGESSSAPTTRPTGGFRANYGFVGTLDDEIRRDPERYVGYGITNTWDNMVEDMHETPDATDDDRSLMSGRLNMLFRDRRAHARTALLMEREARLSCKAWGWSMDASDTARSELRALRTTVLAQQTKLAALRAADRARQAHLVETLRLMSTLQT
ncbi:hypothetical protein Tco_0444489 [Tanacetum coccineum]